MDTYKRKTSINSMGENASANAHKCSIYEANNNKLNGLFVRTASFAVMRVCSSYHDALYLPIYCK